ncbi:hypothetical protein NCCP1664_19670 [Zafaria cholistanensis]|uniref:Phosphatidylglycerol--prolipoprotein diacylglyceryl transferase n=1 Tax=Zafaria cholistanensis TaxID=1682741 RepID=A0A5A7NUJ4_9MICC|nr:prolipoprotein diacylglyceryl transferase [Zafaria cholistanensis]GER23471.1 hypothetical protein NCCP1664_19670 [Zafaria cholistanensis]
MNLAAVSGVLGQLPVQVPASIPSPPPEWSKIVLGPLTVHAYALCILAGIAAALWLTNRRWKAKGGPDGVVWDIVIWAIPFGIIGGRLYHILSSPDAYFGPGFDGSGDLGLTWQIWRGGLGIWGAVALGAVGAWIGCRRAGVRLSAFADAAAPGVLLAQAIGRWGNWFNQELFGAPTTLPWGLEIDATSPNFPASVAAGTLFHPTFLYECLWNLFGVALLLLIDRRFRLRHGAMLWSYVAYYTVGRIWIEALRIDDAEWITLLGVTQRLNVWTSLLLIIVSLAALAFCLVRYRGRGLEEVYLPGRRPVEAATPGSPAESSAAESAATEGRAAAEPASGDAPARPEAPTGGAPSESAPSESAPSESAPSGSTPVQGSMPAEPAAENPGPGAARP